VKDIYYLFGNKVGWTIIYLFSEYYIIKTSINVYLKSIEIKVN